MSTHVNQVDWPEVHGTPQGLLYKGVLLPVSGDTLPQASAANDNLAIYSCVQFNLLDTATGIKTPYRYQADGNLWVDTESSHTNHFARNDATTIVGNVLTPANANGVTVSGVRPCVYPLGRDLTILWASLNFGDVDDPQPDWAIVFGVTRLGSNVSRLDLDFLSPDTLITGTSRNRMYLKKGPFTLADDDPLRVRLSTLAGTGIDTGLNDPIVALRYAYTLPAT